MTTERHRRVNILDSSRLSWFSLWSFGWMNDVIRRAHNEDANENDDHRLDESDLFLPSFRLASGNAYAYFCKAREPDEAQTRGLRGFSSSNSVSTAVPTDGSLLSTAWRLYRFRFFVSAALFIVYAISQVVSPVILKQIIVSLSNDDESNAKPIMLAISLGIVTFIGQLSQTHSVQMITLFLFEFRTALANAVYRKTLRLNANTIDSGNVVNLIATDCQKMLEFLVGLHMGWSSPLIIATAMYFMYEEMGAAMLSCMATMMIAMPVGAKLAAIMSNAQRHVNKCADIRMATIGSVIEGMQVIKYYGWSDACMAMIEEKRQDEIHFLRLYAYVKACSFSVFTIVPFFAAVITFLTFSASGGVLTPANAFTTLALIHVIQFPFTFLPLSINYWIQTILSLNRIQRFLDMPELTVDHIRSVPTASVSIHQTSFDYGLPVSTGGASTLDTSATRIGKHGPMLPDVNFSASDGELVAVVGSVASGKSLLLCSMLGEASRVGFTGNVEAPDRIAYVPQVPFIRTGTVRENIVFGQKWHEQRYNTVLSACQLTTDLMAWPARDFTQIGERGVNVSGGQKQRISLARAAYNINAQLIVMDDPLSAVDPHVSSRIFNECVCGVMDGRTRVLVTHSLDVARKCDRMFVMQRKEVDSSQQSSPSAHDNKKRTRGLRAYASAPAASLMSKPKLPPPVMTKRQLVSHSSTPANLPSSNSQCMIVGHGTYTELQATNEAFRSLQTNEEDEIEVSMVSNTKGNEENNSAKLSRASTKPTGATEVTTAADDKLIVAEERDHGSVSREAYMAYFGAAGGITICASVIVLAAIILGSDFWGSYWIYLWISDLERGTNANHNNSFYIGIYAASVFASSLCIIGKSILVMKAGLSASTQLHKSMIQSLLRKKMSFFQSHPAGRILNRFSKDLYEIDMNLPILFDHSVMSYAAVLLVVVLVAVITTPLLILVVPITCVYAYLSKIYSYVSRSLQRAEAVYRSPVYNHVNETINGLASIRALRVQSSFIAEFEALMDCHQKAAFLTKSTDSWLQIRLDIISGIMILATCTALVLNRSNIPVGIASLLMTQVLTLPHYLTWSVRQSSQIEAKMNSVERVRMFDSTSDQESRGGVVPLRDSIPQWPSKGAIDIQDVQLRYRPTSPLVLKGVSISLEGGKKTGLVGRTGSGKSSLLNCLFRICDFSGDIRVDGIEIKTMPIEFLRQRMAIIPQSPIMLPGTIRFNMDPLSQHTDEDIWTCLEMVDLHTRIDNLNQQVGNEGVSFSMGEKQLFCLARTLLRKPKILCLDEATASVDGVTDAKIQRTLKSYFNDTTIVTIAHRLDTIIGYDSVAVMDDGKVIEYDTPRNLLSQSHSVFSDMLREQHNNNNNNK